MDETQPFSTVPFRPYTWSSYSGSDIRHLVQQTFHQHVDLERSPSLTFYGERTNEPTLYADRALGAENYSDYRQTAGLFERATGLFSEEGQHGKAPDIKTQSDLLCSRLILNGAYKCIKCSKVRGNNLTVQYR